MTIIRLKASSFVHNLLRLLPPNEGYAHKKLEEKNNHAAAYCDFELFNMEHFEMRYWWRIAEGDDFKSAGSAVRASVPGNFPVMPGETKQTKKNKKNMAFGIKIKKAN